MKVLVACEFSGTVAGAFASRGHYAVSCDILPSEVDSTYHFRKYGNIPKHYQGDVRDIIDHGWDLMIAHPPCQYLAVSGMHWTTRGLRDPQLTEQALEFVQFLLDSDIPRIALENPVSIISTRIRKPDQIIQPWQFGEDASKKTCLWLKSLPKLTPTSVVPSVNGVWSNQTPSGQNKLGPSPDRAKKRAATYPGIAKAMADQWGSLP